MGFITLGIMTGSTIATSGAVLMMFNHGIITIGFFLVIDFIQKRRGSILLNDLTGLQGPAPVLAALFTVLMMASVGLPGLSGFIGEFLILLGTFGTHAWWGVFASLGVITAALYLLWLYQRVFHGEAVGDNATITDATQHERLVLAPIILLVVLIGVYPHIALEKITPSVQQIIEHVAPAGATK
jgi:NADH-quinone oxidoreductase subunit M